MKRTKAAKIAKKTKKTRKYDNSSRLEKSNGNRQKIIENYVDLLVEKRGEEISLEELAERAGLSTRTLFRFFGDKKSLTTELETYLETYVTSVAGNLQIMTVEDFAEFAFQVFDKYESLILAYLYTNFGQLSRVVFRRKFNSLLMEKIRAQIPQVQTKEEQHRIYLIITLINANLWSDLRNVYNQTGAEMGKSMKWAVGTLLKNVNS
ncbi:MAG: TetR/AcrR family transcriptional regulator [Pseudobdellovibrio sp.]|nr:TetR/AcrR family transcriptional regulator [Pseudobdellovibrio sp.]